MDSSGIRTLDRPALTSGYKEYVITAPSPFSSETNMNKSLPRSND